MYGIGGVTGALAGGYLTDADNELWCFAVRALVGLLMAFAACFITKAVEMDADERVQASLWTRVKANCSDVYRGTVRTPELYKTLLFFVVMGCVVPSYEDYLYYYQVDITGFTQIQYSYLKVITYVVLFLSAAAYGSLFGGVSVRVMLFAAICINIFGCLTTVMFCTGHTIGIPPYAFVCMTGTVMSEIYSAYTSLPSGITFSKLIPEDVETSMFAMLTGLLNFANLFAAKEVALGLNKFVGVYYETETDNNLNEVWKLYCV